MYTDTTAIQMVNDRGPRWAVRGTIRAGESRTAYADTGERAEQIRAEFESPHWGYRNVTVHPPEDDIDLRALGNARVDAKRALDEATAILRAGVLRALEAGRTEAEISRTGQIDRMTVRTWAGK